MIATAIYLLTVVYFSHTLYKYMTCKISSIGRYSCFDEGAESFLGLIDSEDYDFH